MAKVKNASQWGSAKARERYPCGGMVKRDVGGKVEPLRIPLTDISDRLDRLKSAGILNTEAATDFTAARMKRLGLDPEKYVGRPARYQRGGKK